VKTLLFFFVASFCAQAASTCDRACLKGFIDKYCAALAMHDPTPLPLAPNVKFTENSTTMKLGDGLWKTAGPTTYRLYLLDPTSGAAALQSVIKENGALTSFFLRLKIVDKQIAEIETIVTRKNESNVFAPEKLTAPDPLWAQVVPPAERATREQLIAAANAYFDAIETQSGNYKPAPFAADCNRFENGGQTTNVPGPNGRPPMGCAAQFDAKIFTWIPEVNDRRFPVVDTEHGVVLGIVMFGEPGGQSVAGSDKKRKREATLLAEAFKVTGGQIRRINAVMINRPYHAPTGWNEADNHASWRDYLGGSDSAQYSALDQINMSNVNQLQVAWSYPTGDKNNYSFNPVIVDGVMYVQAKSNSIVALDAATGREIWVHPNDTRSITARGVNYWESKDRSDRRLLYCVDSYLVAIDARTGQSIPSFGENGRSDLRVGFDRDVKTLTRVQNNTPGRVFENLIILGSATNGEYESNPGAIRAFDVITGKLAWVFHTIPHPGEFGYDTWPKDAWKTVGGVQNWSEMTLDEKRGILYIPLASPSYDFYGANRKGQNLFGNCLLALDAHTGKRLWHFQFVHHDLWDYDAPAAPKLLTVRHSGKMLDAVAQPTKQGFLFVFDRETGEPLWPIEERAVPKSDVPGEESWPTQPFPTKPPPFARQKFSSDDLNPFIPEAERATLRDKILSSRNEGLYTPPSLRGTIEMPGHNGGGNWGGSAVDPSAGLLYVQSKELPTYLKLDPRPPRTGAPTGTAVYSENCAGCHGADRASQAGAIPSLIDVTTRLTADQIKSVVQNGQGRMPAFSQLTARTLDVLVAYLANPAAATAAPEPPPAATASNGPQRYWAPYDFLLASDRLSAIGPPWSQLTAYDLNTGTVKWQVPLGEVSALAADGHTDTGSHWPRGGLIATAGGLLFSATTSDRKFRAYDRDTGKVIWETGIAEASEGVPAVYEVGGREYIVLCVASGNGIMGGQSAQKAGAYVAYALPSR
jgi:quinoprotein glucose dehydrogenase